MSNSNKAEIVLEGNARGAINALKQTENQIKTFGERSIATFNRMGQSVKTFSDRYIHMLAGIGVGVGLGEMTRDILDFEGALRKIQRTGNLTADEIGGLRKEVLGLIDPASKVKIALTKGQWVDLAGALRDANVELKTTKDILPQIGKGAVASGLDDKRLYAKTIGEFIDKYRVGVKELPALQDQLNAAMKMPGVRGEPQAFLEGLAGLAKPMQLIGATGMKNVTPLIALFAELSHVSGSSGEALTGMDALINGFFRLMRNEKLMQGLAANGVHFFDKDKNLKDLNALLPEFKKLEEAGKKHGMSMEETAMQVFGRPEAAKAIMTIIGKYDEIIGKEKQLAGASGDMERDFTLEMRSVSASLTTFQNQLDSFKVSGMATALKYLSHVLDELIAHPLIAKGLIAGLLGLGGVIVLEKLIGAFGSLAGFMKDIGGIWGKGGKKGGLGALASTGGAIPVYVTNWGGSSAIPQGPIPGQRTGETAAGTALGKAALQYGGAALAGLEALGIGASLTVGAIATAVVAALVGNEINRRKLGDQGMIDIMRRRDWQGSAAAGAIKNEINLYVQGVGPVQVHSDPTDMNTRIGLKRGPQ